VCRVAPAAARPPARRAHRHRGAGIRYRRLHSSASGAVWLRGAEAHVWSCVSLRLGGFCFVTGSDRTNHEDSGGFGPASRITCAARTRGTRATLDVSVPDFTKGLKDGVKGLRIGMPKEYFIDGTHPAVSAAVGGGDEAAGVPWRGDRGGLAAAHGLRRGHLLHPRASGGVGESRALRRRALWASHRDSGRLAGALHEHAGGGLRPRSEAPHLARAPTC